MYTGLKRMNKKNVNILDYLQINTLTYYNTQKSLEIVKNIYYLLNNK